MKQMVDKSGDEQVVEQEWGDAKTLLRVGYHATSPAFEGREGIVFHAPNPKKMWPEEGKRPTPEEYWDMMEQAGICAFVSAANVLAKMSCGHLKCALMQMTIALTERIDAIIEEEAQNNPNGLTH